VSFSGEKEVWPHPKVVPSGRVRPDALRRPAVRPQLKRDRVGARHSLVKILQNHLCAGRTRRTRVDDAHAYHAQLLEREIASLSTIADEPWGMREFSIKTPDGQHIKIGQAIRA